MSGTEPRRLCARAPGKLVALGEYAVLDGAPALVLAVDRYCRASLRDSSAARCSLDAFFPQPRRFEADPGEATGVDLIDLVATAWPLPAARRTTGWSGALDSRALYGAAGKLGLGSSAAALCAWASVWHAWVQSAATPVARPPLAALIDLHRRLQGGSGSGIDVAAAYTGGVVEFRLDAGSVPHVGSVRLPDSVGFAGIFTGRPASTPDFVARYRRWKAERPAEAAYRKKVMEDIALGGCAAANQGDSGGFLHAVEQYGRELSVLGRAIGADIVTAEHLAIGEHARRFGVAYKVSGAGGGDLGIAFAADADALRAFVQAVAERGYEGVDLELDRQGLVVEEQAE